VQTYYSAQNTLENIGIKNESCLQTSSGLLGREEVNSVFINHSRDISGRQIFGST
jgi:hypothetical protein